MVVAEHSVGHAQPLQQRRITLQGQDQDKDRIQRVAKGREGENREKISEIIGGGRETNPHGSRNSMLRGVQYCCWSVKPSYARYSLPLTYHEEDNGDGDAQPLLDVVDVIPRVADAKVKDHGCHLHRHQVAAKSLPHLANICREIARRELMMISGVGRDDGSERTRSDGMIGDGMR